MLNYILSARMVELCPCRPLWRVCFARTKHHKMPVSRDRRRCQMLFGRTRTIRIYLISLDEGFVENYSLEASGLTSDDVAFPISFEVAHNRIGSGGLGGVTV